jgi:hypothetical protein
MNPSMIDTNETNATEKVVFFEIVKFLNIQTPHFVYRDILANKMLQYDYKIN